MLSDKIYSSEKMSLEVNVLLVIAAVLAGCGLVIVLSKAKAPVQRESSTLNTLSPMCFTANKPALKTAPRLSVL